VGEREELEARREFLIRSLEDLEAERAAGNIDDETYARLHGDYTARAAAVLRELDGENGSEPPEAESVPAGRRALVIGAIVAFAIAAAVVLGVTIAPRLPGQTVTGGVTATTQPSAYDAHIQRARSLISTDPVGALKQYAAAARLKPNEAEPPTYTGWIYALSSQDATAAADRAQLIDRALQDFATAHRVDPQYADAYAFDGIVHLRFLNDAKGAIPLLQKYLQLEPSGPQVSDVRSELRAAQQAAKAPAGAGTTTTAG
jgi:tetratricopeptide (TPR) repeat protein